MTHISASVKFTLKKPPKGGRLTGEDVVFCRDEGVALGGMAAAMNKRLFEFASATGLYTTEELNAEIERCERLMGRMRFEETQDERTTES